MQGRGVEQRADMVQRVPQRGVRLAADVRGALVGRVQAEYHAHRGGFAGAVRADEAGHLAGEDREGHPVERHAGPNRLRSPATSIVASMVGESTVRAGPGSSRARAVFRAPVPGVPNGPVLPRTSYPPIACRGGRGHAALRGQCKAWSRTG